MSGEREINPCERIQDFLLVHLDGRISQNRKSPFNCQVINNMEPKKDKENKILFETPKPFNGLKGFVNLKGWLSMLGLLSTLPYKDFKVLNMEDDVDLDWNIVEGKGMRKNKLDVGNEGKLGRPSKKESKERKIEK